MDDAADIFCTKMTADDNFSTLKSAGGDETGTHVNTEMDVVMGTKSNAQGGCNLPNPKKKNVHGGLGLKAAAGVHATRGIGIGRGSGEMEVCEEELPEKNARITDIIGDVKKTEAMEDVEEESSNAAASVSCATKGEFPEGSGRVKGAMDVIEGELPEEGNVRVREAMEGIIEEESSNAAAAAAAAASASCTTKGELPMEGNVSAAEAMEGIIEEGSSIAAAAAAAKSCTTKGELAEGKVRVREAMEGIIEEGNIPAAAKNRTTKGVSAPPRSRSTLLQPTEAVQGVLDTVVQGMRSAADHPDNNRGRKSRPLFDSAPALLKLCEVSQARVGGVAGRYNRREGRVLRYSTGHPIRNRVINKKGRLRFTDK